MAVPSLQLQCLYSVVGRLDEYGTQTLSLLPVSLRRQLLLHLPVADICRLEEDQAFMSGLDPDTIWSKLHKFSIVYWNPSIYPRPQYPSAKDSLLSEVAHVFLTKSGGKHRLGLLTYSLFGIHVCKSMSVVRMALFREHQFLQLSEKLFSIRWALPQRYVSESEVATISEMLEKFINYCRWYPTIVELHGMTDYYPERFEIFLRLLPCIEEVYLYSSCVFVMAGVLQIVKAAKKRALKTVSLAGNSDDLYSLISALFTALHYDCADGGVQLYGGLKKLELVVEDLWGYDLKSVSSTSAMEDLAQLISNQEGLETLIVAHGHFSSVKNRWFAHFAFLNYLPHFILKTSFRHLRIEQCNVPTNSMKNMIVAFLNSTASSYQSLEFIDCVLMDQSHNTISTECNLKQPAEYRLFNPVGGRCVAGEQKSLAVQVNNHNFPLHWLVEYPGFQLNRLDLQHTMPGIITTQETGFDTTCETLAWFGQNVNTLCVSFLGGHTCHGSVGKVLANPHLSEMRLMNCAHSSDTSIMAVMSGSIHNALSLRKISFEAQGYEGFSFNSSRYFRSFFAALFNMPKEWLGNLALDFSESLISSSVMDNVVEEWKANARGQKLRAIRYSNAKCFPPTQCRVHEIAVEHSA